MRMVAAFLGAAIGTWFLTQIALRIGWIDQRGGQEHRKLRRHPVALVGGAAILFGVFFAMGLAAIDSPFTVASFTEDLRGMAWPGLLGAFALGLLDDIAPGGLSARVKFAGQLLVAALVVLFPGSVFADASAIECIGLGVLALVAMNAVNLFDHADGLVGILCGLGMAAGRAPLAPLFAVAAAGYLPFNLLFRRAADDTPVDVGEERTHSAPFAMLGDSGSHLVGVLLATTPGAWWFLVLPILDMIRVVGKRLLEGRPFWRGDRTHLGHLLQGIGFSPVTTALLVGTLLLPALATVTLMDGPAPLFSGLLATAALYFGMLVMADHAIGEDARTEENWRAVEPELPPRGASREPSGESSVSDVFARASGVEDEPRRGSRILKPLGRPAEQKGKGGGDEDSQASGAQEPAPRTPGKDRAKPSTEPSAPPSASQDAPSGPFADPSPGELDA